MRRFVMVIISLAAVAGIGLAFLATPVLAKNDITQDNIKAVCDNNPNSTVCRDLDNPDAGKGVPHLFQNIINILLYAAGLVAIIMIVVSGIRFVTSRGDSNTVTKARQTLIYSVVGLLIAVLAFAVVNFVFSRLGG